VSVVQIKVGNNVKNVFHEVEPYCQKPENEIFYETRDKEPLRPTCNGISIKILQYDITSSHRSKRPDAEENYGGSK